MSDWDSPEDEDDKTISLDDLESMESSQEGDEHSLYDEDDWGDSYDDLDSEAWERQYNHDEEELERDPWELD